MNTLKTSSLDTMLDSWPALQDLCTQLDPESGIFPREIEGIKNGLNGFFFKKFVSEHPGDIVVVVPTEKDCTDLSLDLAGAGFEGQIHILPWWGTVPYRPVAKGSVTFGERAAFLSKLATRSTESRIFIVHQRALQTPVPPADYEKSLLFSIKKGSDFDPVKISEMLTATGYIRVPRVTVKGEFALRGEVLDIFMPGEESPHRVVFDFDTIDQIKTFDIETQVSKENLDQLTLYPMKEVVWTEELVSALEPKLEPIFSPVLGQDESGQIPVRDVEDFKDRCTTMITELSVNGETEGEELFYPLAFDRQSTVLDYIDEKVPVFFLDYDRLDNAEESFDREYLGLYRQARQERPVPAPNVVFMHFKDVIEKHEKRVLFRTISGSDITGAPRIRIDCDAPHSYFGNIAYLKESLGGLVRNSWNIFIFAESENQALRINELLRNLTHPTWDDVKELEDAGKESDREDKKEKNWLKNDAPVFKDSKQDLEDLKTFGTGVKRNPGQNRPKISKNAVLSTGSAAVRKEPPVPHVFVLPKAISGGFGISELKVLVIQENEIFGRRVHTPQSVKKAKSSVIDTFVELNPGDYVVHVNHGIGRFLGIERVRAMGNERDYIKLEYADEETVFIPIEQVNLVQRYIGNEGDAPRLDRIGSKSWENRKNKVKKSVEDLAEKLIGIYSKRKAARGFAFPKDTEWQTAFEAAFPYTETDDQITVANEIKADMEKPVPMDRLVCGDVGYGKTEMAMRAAFKAVMGGKQVAFLAPTTLLAEQHYESMKNRFENFPVKVAQLSRFVPPAEQKKTLEKLSQGGIDILVGTHRIIQKDVKFKDLGLMIIDEEQRFGVKDKEKLKEMKTNIDCLAMSATPIPRTLHMSLLKIRDMSLLTTPPHNRIPIETVIDSYNDDRIAAAIRREVERGGQVFYLHNRVESLEEIRLKLQSLVPEMIIETAHGQMTSNELDDIFRRFKLGGFHVLVATTIIENGIDIPNVNTIIIDRADMYGVSQLYQLRGRVGRSDRKAYAYLFYPENKALSEVAMKRLQVISDFTELGSGFKIAMKDMEIRGAGNLLGRDQSGDVYSVGFDMYLRLLESAVQRLTNENYQAENETLLELEYTGFIPDTYILNPQTKMEVYKKIASISNKTEFDQVYNELQDRFGPLPDEVYSLMALAEIRIFCKKLQISTLQEHGGRAQIEFAQVSAINVDKVLRLIKESSGLVKLDPLRPNVLILNTGKIGLKEKSSFIREKLESIAS